MNKRDLLLKSLAITIIAVIMFACSPQKTEKQKVIMEFETTQDNTTASIPDSTPPSAEPPANNFFKYLGFERTTHSDIKIWGWSRDGKAAYSNYISFEGDVFFVYILDMVNDTVLWQNALDLFDDPHPYEENYHWFNGDFYLDFIDNFKNICVQNGIEFIPAEFKELPIRYNNQTVNIILEKNETSLSYSEMDNLLIIGGKYEGYKIIAENQGKQKIIREKDFNIPRGSLTIYADDIFVCGYFISPFENRSLIVIGELAHSWEGSDVTYSFAGCHLSIGFK